MRYDIAANPMFNRVYRRLSADSKPFASTGTIDHSSTISGSLRTGKLTEFAMKQ